MAALVALGCCGAGSGLAAAERPVRSFVPAEAFVAVLGDGQCPGAAETAVWRFFHEPEVRASLEQFRPILSALTESAAEEGMDVAALGRLFTRTQWCAAFGRTKEVRTQPALVLAFAAGEGGPRADADTLLTALREGAEEDAVEDVEVAGVQLTAQRSETGELSYYGFAGPVFVIGTDKALLTSALDPDAAKLELAPAKEPAVLRVVYDHGALLRAFAEELEKSPQTGRILDAIGVSAVRTAEVALVPRGKRLVSQFDLHIPEGEKRLGLAKWLADAPPVDRELLKRVPRDAMLFYATSADFPALWDEAWGMVKAIDPDVAANGQLQLNELQQRLGVDIRKELLAHIDRGSVFITHGATWMGGGGIAIQKVRDGDALEAAIAGMVNRLDVALMGAGQVGMVRSQLKAFTYRGRQCHYLWMLGMPALAFGGSAPAYTRLDDAFIVAQHPLYLKQYIDFLEDEEPSILEHPDFEALQDTVPEDAAMVSFAAWPDSVVGLYNTAAPFLAALQGIPDLPEPLDVANLPSSRLIRRYARGTVLYSTFQDGHYRVELQGDGLDVLSPQVAPLGVAGIAAGMLLPALGRARTEARAVRDMNNLRQIGMACATYLNEQGGNRNFPPGLAALWEEELIVDPGVLISPLDVPDPPKLPDGPPCSYQSAFDKYPKRQFRDDFPPNTIMAWDREPFIRGERNVLFFDAHVERVNEARFQRLLEELDQQVEEHTAPRGEKQPAGGEF
jgi:prepilin-type processing-associated H-X9-DG protein